MGYTDDLQPGAVNDFVVDGELATTIIDDQDADTTAAIGEGIIQS